MKNPLSETPKTVEKSLKLHRNFKDVQKNFQFSSLPSPRQKY